MTTENTRIAAAYQSVMEPLGDPRTVAFESAFAALPIAAPGLPYFSPTGSTPE